jgi:NitT/TauT family transport system ATP-binding protein
MTDQQSAAPVITFDHVGKTFPGQRALEDLHFSIDRGELVSVVGVTGCGKSTMFNLTLGLFAGSPSCSRTPGSCPGAQPCRTSASA